jgi:hypothetical protein
LIFVHFNFDGDSHRISYIAKFCAQNEQDIKVGFIFVETFKPQYS